MTKTSLAQPLFLLHCNGLDPKRNNIYALLRRIVAAILIILLILLDLAELLFNFKGFDTAIRCIEGLGHVHQSLSKFFCVWIKQDEIVEILKIPPQFWPLNHCGPEIERQTKRIHLFGKRYFKIFVTASILTMVPYLTAVYHGFPLIATYLENDEAPVWYKTFVTCIQLPAGFVCITVFCGFDALFFFLAAHGLSELKIIKYSFRALQKLERRQQRFKLIETIQHHSQVLDYLKKMSDTVSSALLQVYLSNLISMCFGLILLSKDGLPPPDPNESIKYISNIMFYALQVWLFSFVGNLIIDWSLEIPNEIFYSVYGSGVETNRSNILMMINRSQLPAVISVGGFVNCDLETFAEVMKSSMSVFTFVNTIKENNEA